MLALVLATSSFVVPAPAPGLAARHVALAPAYAPARLAPTMAEVPLLEGLNCGSFSERMSTSAEVTLSKIFPAGAGWQLASAVADGCGYGATSLKFFACVGLGDAGGVFLGHLAYQAAKKVVGRATLPHTRCMPTPCTFH